MGMKIAKTRKPKITVLPDGRCVVSGLTLSDLSDILVAADLHYLLNPFKPQKITKKTLWPECVKLNNKISSEWFRKVTWIVKSLKDAVDNHGRRPKPAKSLKETLQENKTEREFLETIISEALNGR